MSTDEFQALWKAYDTRLEQSLQLNKRIWTELQHQKAQSALRPLIASRITGIVIGMIWLILMAVCLVFTISQPIMAISFAVFFACTGFAIIGYGRDLSIIRTISFTDSIVDTQKKLAGMQAAMIRDLRWMWMQLPFWSVF